MAVEPKIAYVMGSWPVWSETFIQQELRLLLDAGLPILPIAIFPGDQKPTTGLPHVAVLEKSRPQLGEASQRKGHDWTPVVVRRQAALIKHSGKINTLVSLLQSNNAVHIHAAFAELPGLITSAASRKLGIPYSVSVHAHDGLCGKYDDRYIFDRADFIYGCNKRVLFEVSTRSPWLANQLEYVPHGLRLDEWPMRSPQALGSSLKFLFVGRLVEKKDPVAALRLVETLRRSGIEADITFVGDGPLRDGIPTVGVLPRNEVRDLMEQSDFLIGTSRELDDGDMEGVPNVILEAMATGLPVLAPRTGGIGEVLTAATGFEIDPDDRDAFCSCIRGIQANPSVVDPTIAAARELVEKSYQVEVNLQTKIKRFQGYLG